LTCRFAEIRELTKRRSSATGSSALLKKPSGPLTRVRRYTIWIELTENPNQNLGKPNKQKIKNIIFNKSEKSKQQIREIHIKIQDNQTKNNKVAKSKR
jgi:hypothetical protein